MISSIHISYALNYISLSLFISTLSYSLIIDSPHINIQSNLLIAVSIMIHYALSIKSYIVSFILTNSISHSFIS